MIKGSLLLICVPPIVPKTMVMICMLWSWKDVGWELLAIILYHVKTEVEAKNFTELRSRFGDITGISAST